MEDIQEILNSTEISLHQLTALVDCRSLHMVRKKGVQGVRVGGGAGEGGGSFSRNSQRLISCDTFVA